MHSELHTAQRATAVKKFGVFQINRDKPVVY